MQSLPMPTLPIVQKSKLFWGKKLGDDVILVQQNKTKHKKQNQKKKKKTNKQTNKKTKQNKTKKKYNKI